MRVGIGYDVHRFVHDRPLVLGGVTIPFDKGLLGHSDADVLVHAACDALLGAAGLGDLGEHFPDTDETYRGIYSIELLKRCRQLVHEKGFGIVNLDGVILAQVPKLNSYRKDMEKTMAGALGIPADRINIKATTTEGLGFVGRREGIAAQCVVLIDAL
jgi:2-C-methyl-D-erythritol 2,4-cyclodiphosphate synthase